MNVKLKEEKTPLPVVNPNKEIDLLLFLIREDLKAHKLWHGFNEMNCGESPYLPDLTDAVLDVAGFSETCRTNELYDAYYFMMDKYFGLLDGSDEMLAKIAAVVCTELSKMKLTIKNE